MSAYIYKGTPAAQDVECFAQRYDANDSAPPNTHGLVLSITETSHPDPVESGGRIHILEIDDLVNGTTNEFSVLREYIQVVCALPPQTGVNSLHFDYDDIAL